MAHLVAAFTKPDKSLNIHCIREFTPSQKSELETFLSEFVKLRQRFSLLHVVHENHAALKTFIDELKDIERHCSNAAMCEANRHLFNYLSTAYALREHLETAIKKDFGRRSGEWLKFQKFTTTLETQSFDYAFIQDFRNFVQHCGFPVGNMTITLEQNGRAVSITYNRSDLLSAYDRWEKCRLRTRPEAVLDLLRIIDRHHQILINEFPIAIHDSYGKNLDALETYFLSLQVEAKKIRNDAVARIVTAFPSNPERGTLTFKDIPDDPLGELGLERTTNEAG